MNAYHTIVAVFDEIKTKYRCAVITSSPRSYAERVLFHLKIIPEVLVTYRDTHLHKPHPAPVYRAMELLGMVSEMCVFIGDSEKDFLACRSAGVAFIAVTWGELNRAAFESFECGNSVRPAIGNLDASLNSFFG